MFFLVGHPALPGGRELCSAWSFRRSGSSLLSHNSTILQGRDCHHRTFNCIPPCMCQTCSLPPVGTLQMLPLRSQALGQDFAVAGGSWICMPLRMLANMCWVGSSRAQLFFLFRIWFCKNICAVQLIHLCGQHPETVLLPRCSLISPSPTKVTPLEYATCQPVSPCEPVIPSLLLL